MPVLVIIVNEVKKGTDLPYNRLSFLHKDRLGSIVSVTNDQGIETEWHAFDAFGSPKQGNLSSSGGLLRTTNTVYSLDVSDEEYGTNRGFTGHEHLDDVKLIHMNGRVYDPGMGRFLSVDPERIQWTGTDKKKKTFIDGFINKNIFLN